ncbi:alpha/beta fold hydrolase [Alteromonas confluentis]|uniref:AB hydrolase-1 domain-containing protein n=1 Tax=Alteromonas confluentis TaxID=1656094 RepID=A0A1E7ZGM2_9ALTE|nr:alpha/beta hydrolase [Alteromonas confluentis]OFC72658.1 hypothetical protein BFC18_02070 [Alteromonas confluentis]
MTIIHFAHANGFPAATYKTMFNRLPESWQILANPQFGHCVEFPVSQNWMYQVDELIHYLDRCDVDEPVWLVGHSFGAVVSFLTACRHPEWVKGVIMLDPPLVYGVKRYVVQSAKWFNLMDNITPSKLARIRRTQWHKEDDIEGYFAAKKLFRTMDKRCIRDYVNSATRVEGAMRRLTFSNQVEADIFRHFPHNLKKFAGKLKCPGLLVGGTDSHVSSSADRARFAKDNGIEVKMYAGGHMFPLEDPEGVAALITATLKGWIKR